MSNKISIILCTKGRLNILKKTLTSLFFLSKKDATIILIDNNTDNILEKIEEKIPQSLSFIKVKEKTIGLSFARNKGINLAKSPWLIFLDDDVQINETFLSKAMEIIESNQFDCFGGMYYPWYPEGKPKWLPNDFGKKTPLLKKTGLIHLPDDGFLSAGILAIKKEALNTIGGFRTDLGMTEGIGYGEEDDLQLRLQAAGYRIGFVPDWYMHHAVLSHKHHLRWHLKSAFARGRDSQKIHCLNSWIVLLKWFQVLVTGLVKRFPESVFRLIFQKKYYWQNAVIFILNPILIWTGKLWATKF